MSKKPKQKQKKTTLDYCELMDLDLDRFFEDAVRERSLFKVMESLARACTSQVALFQSYLARDTRSSERALSEDQIEFFGEAAMRISDVRATLSPPGQAESCRLRLVITGFIRSYAWRRLPVEPSESSSRY